MRHIGQYVRELRRLSVHHDIRSFAQHVGLSFEGLRKIEMGERVPTAESVAKIIEAMDLPDDLAHEMWVSRDLEHAARENLLDRGVTDKMIGKLARECQTVVTDFLAEFDLGLPEEDQHDLLGRLQESIRERLRARPTLPGEEP